MGAVCSCKPERLAADDLDRARMVCRPLYSFYEYALDPHLPVEDMDNDELEEIDRLFHVRIPTP